MGKGDTYRKVNWAEYSANYDRIFGAKPQKETDNAEEKISKNEEVIQNQMDKSPTEREVSTNPSGLLG